MGRAPCCSKVGLHRGPWTPKEDALLIKYIQAHGEGQWRSLPKNAGLLRCGKSCRLRWMNYLRPDIKRGNITLEEEDLIIKLHGLLGNRWSLIAKRLPGRTDNEIKNYWNTHLNKKLRNQGIDPNTHKQLSQVLDGENSANGKKRSRITKNNHTNRSKTQKPNEVDDKKGDFMVKTKDENTSIGDERGRTKIHLPKPIRVSPIISLTRNNSNGSFEAHYMSTASSGSSNSQSQNPKDELAFDSENIMLDIPWLSSTTSMVDQNGLDHVMMMGSSSCGDHDVNVDIIQHHDHHYGVAASDNHNQPLENLYQEYLQLIKADQYHDVGDGGDHHDHDDAYYFTKSFLI
ncbi:hypothetical protein Cgig2_031047 [Carnegiea gigantea]|uniref:Uncharacterized protein n=1 Tax=Carnegiea gigantea TaxID=171969 RepID=A0A9Q1KBW4_9CARY|nr:hypothetical protein Cgig2_031047 [Carnegiea gigantea]